MSNLYRDKITANEISNLIFKAWDDSKLVIDKSQDEYNRVELKPEYLITVKIADRIINEIIETNISNFSLKLEEQTKYVFKRCFQDVKRDQNNNLKIIFRGSKNSVLRNGKFDITVYKKDLRSSIDNYRTYFVIEVKNIEKSYKKLKADLDRISELICCTHDIGANSIKYGIFTFSKKLIKKEMIDFLFRKRKNFIRRKNKTEMLNKLGLKNNNNITIKTHDIYNKINSEEGLELSYCFLIYNIIINTSSPSVARLKI